MSAQRIVTETGSHVVPACPWWCTKPDDHELADGRFESFDGSVMRQHATEAQVIETLDGPIEAHLARVDAVPQDGARTDRVVVWADRGFTADQAERFADTLRSLAGLLRVIEQSKDQR